VLNGVFVTYNLLPLFMNRVLTMGFMALQRGLFGAYDYAISFNGGTRAFYLL
jgi:hypothetical protein